MQHREFIVSDSFDTVVICHITILLHLDGGSESSD
jgi:hypothetical protein